MEFVHESVLLHEAVSGLDIKPDGIYVDATTGGGGHSERIAQSLAVGRLICIDKDKDALTAARKRLSPLGQVISFIQDDHRNLASILKGLGIDGVDGVLLDLGVSSYQLDEASRGFSYMAEDAPLDMRMDRSSGQTAADILMEYGEDELTTIFKEYGEEKNAKKIARAIESARKKAPIKTAGDLNAIIRSAVPANAPGGHPSKRVFMALRIEVNGELCGLYEYVKSIPALLNEGGRVSIITFHSLEDRAVKNAFRDLADPCTCPKNFPVCVCGKKSEGRIITRKPILPSDDEIAGNSRAKSAKLRIFEKRIG